MRLFRWVSLVGLIAASACLSDPFAPTPLDPDERAALAQARERWRARNVTEYTLESRYACFCDPTAMAWTEVRVRRDSIVDATMLEKLQFYDGPARPELWHTVPALFALVESFANDAVTRDVRVTYDPEYGYPRTIDLTCVPNVTDCGYHFEARNLHMLR